MLLLLLLLLLQIFDVSPLFGTIQPGSTDLFAFTFFGHSFIECQTVAQCNIEHGPVYDCVLRGQASDIRYTFNSMEIDLGFVVCI